MSTWSWRFESPDGQPLGPESVPPQVFPTRSDAEMWVGESWEELLEAGVEQVRLFQGDEEVFGPMSLRPSP